MPRFQIKWGNPCGCRKTTARIPSARKLSPSPISRQAALQGLAETSALSTPPNSVRPSKPQAFTPARRPSGDGPRLTLPSEVGKTRPHQHGRAANRSKSSCRGWQRRGFSKTCLLFSALIASSSSPTGEIHEPEMLSRITHNHEKAKSLRRKFQQQPLRGGGHVWRPLHGC
jgi:hypothetical protein